MPPKRLTAEEVLKGLLGLTPSKQAHVIEGWPGFVGQTKDGMTFRASSKKELRRFVAEQDSCLLDWVGTLEPGGVFYDIGANVGTITLAVAGRQGTSVTLVPIEPSVGSFESLVRNLDLNGLLATAIPLQVALSDETGLQRLNYTSLGAGNSLHAVGEPVDYEGRPFVPAAVQLVPVFRLDDLVDVLDLPRPTHVKIDVDGHEEQVLRGARTSLSRCSDVFVEIVDHDRAGTRPAAIDALLRSYDFELIDRYPHPKPHISDYLYRRRV